jgi:hypothetical protein
MKTSIIYPVVLILIFAFTSCKKEFPNDPLSLTNFSISDCKTKGASVKGTGNEYITLQTVNDYYLLFSHINSVFNCQPGQITISLEISADTITINEDETDASANCICPYDLKFRLGPLKYANYTVVFQKFGITFKEYSLEFKKSTNVKIDL